jgi:hypothetical protein
MAEDEKPDVEHVVEAPAEAEYQEQETFEDEDYASDESGQAVKVKQKAGEPVIRPWTSTFNHHIVFSFVTTIRFSRTAFKLSGYLALLILIARCTECKKVRLLTDTSSAGRAGYRLDKKCANARRSLEAHYRKRNRHDEFKKMSAQDTS